MVIIFKRYRLAARAYNDDIYHHNSPSVCLVYLPPLVKESPTLKNSGRHKNVDCCDGQRGDKAARSAVSLGTL